MKIIKRKQSNPLGTLPMILIPSLTYALEKAGGLKFNQYEWLWSVGISIVTLLWFLLNYKIIKNESKG